MSDLHKYTKIFHPDISRKFKSNLSVRKNDINKRLGKNIEERYEQILDWRHDFAHAGKRNTTIEEAMQTHRFALRVIFCFDDAFESV